MRLPKTDTDESTCMSVLVDEAKREFDKAIDGAEALFKQHGITKVAIYQTVPLELEVSVISSHGRRYFDLFSKLDQMMPILKTLEIEDIRSNGMVDKERAAYKRLIIGLQSSARGFAAGLRRRMNQEDAQATSGPERAGQLAQPGSADVIPISTADAAPGGRGKAHNEPTHAEPPDDGAVDVTRLEPAAVAAS